MTLRRAKKIFMPKRIHCSTLIISLKGIENKKRGNEKRVTMKWSELTPQCPTILITIL